MPNWCENEIHISGPRDEMERFRDVFFTEDEKQGPWINFYEVAPLGLGNDDKGEPNWDYEIAVKKWGTKWAPNQEDSWDSHTSKLFMDLHGCFDTAWGPPEGIYNLMEEWIDDNDSEIFVDWFYKEPGMRFAGWLGDD
jgi:hypothetical protein